MNVQLQRLRVLLIKEEEWWVAQCLEYDFAGQAKSIDEATYQLLNLIAGHIAIHEELGLDPFENVVEAPKPYWTRFEKANAVEV